MEDIMTLCTLMGAFIVFMPLYIYLMEKEYKNKIKKDT